MTEFAKRGLPHTSDLQFSTIHNFRCVKAMDPQIVQFRALRTGESFKLVSYLSTKLWSFKIRKLDVCGRPLFANSVTIKEQLSSFGACYIEVSQTFQWKVIAVKTLTICYNSTISFGCFPSYVRLNAFCSIKLSSDFLNFIYKKYVDK